MHTRCVGHNQKGGPCNAQPLRTTGKKVPPEGSPRCPHHLGQPKALIEAQYNAQQQATELFRQQQAAARRYGLTDLVDPLHALHILADEVWRWKGVCQQLVGDLTEIRYRSNSGEQIRGEIALYEKSLDRAAKLLADLTRLGIEDRLERVSGRQNTLIVHAVTAAVVELGELLEFDADQQVVGDVISRHLKEIERDG